MIGSALRFPLDASRGRAHLIGVTGALLATAIALRIAVGLFPLVLAVVPAAAALVSWIVAAAIFAAAFLDPDEPIPDARTLVWTGSVATLTSVITLAVPVWLLFWTVLGFAATGESGAGGGGIAFLLASTTAVVAFLGATYVLPVLVGRAITSDGIGALVDGRQLRVALTHLPYLQGWSLGIALSVLGGWATLTGLTSTTFVGLLAIVGGAYCLLAGVRAVGKGYASVPGIDGGT